MEKAYFDIYADSGSLLHHMKTSHEALWLHHKQCLFPHCPGIDAWYGQECLVTACIFMPLEGETVIKTCSDAMTPAVPPIYTQACLGDQAYD